MNFGAKARAVRERGVQERGNFTPSGTPLKMYEYWLKNSESKKAKSIKYKGMKENFCHYWRVVAFWAPMVFLKDKFLDFADTTAGIVTIAAALIALVFVGGSLGFGVVPFLITVAVLVSIIAGIVAGIVLGSREYVDNRERNIWILVALVGLPSFLLVYGLARLHANWKKSWDKYVEKAFFVIVGLLGVFAVGLLIFGLWSDFGWMGIVGLVLGLLAIAAVIIGFAFLADYISGRRQMREDAAWEEKMEFVEKHGRMPSEVPAEPGALARFFSGLGDFIVFVFQIVRVKKWKICPIVEVPAER